MQAKIAPNSIHVALVEMGAKGTISICIYKNGKD